MTLKVNIKISKISKTNLLIKFQTISILKINLMNKTEINKNINTIIIIIIRKIPKNNFNLGA